MSTSKETAAEVREIKIAHSPDSDDAFMTVEASGASKTSFFSLPAVQLCDGKLQLSSAGAPGLHC